MMFSLVAALLWAAIISLTLFIYNHYTYWKRRGIPQETPLPLLGNFRGIGRTKHFRDIIQPLYEKFKGQTPFGGLYMFVTKTALILDLELVKHILSKDFAYFHDRGIFNNVRDDPLTGHLVTLEGEQWRAMRTKLTPAFTSARMKSMYPLIVKVASSLDNTVADLLEESSDGILEMKDICARFTTDVIGTCAFGVECNSLKDPQAEFRRKGRSIFTERLHNPLLQQFMFTHPGIARKLRMKMFPKSITTFFLDLIRESVEYRLQNNVKRNDFLDLLIELKAKDQDLAKASKGIDLSQGLTIEQMAAQTFFFFFAGFETSSSTMTFCLYELARHQEIQTKLRKELLKSLKENKNEFTYESIHALSYLDQVVSETLRRHPVLPQLIRKTMHNYQVPNSSHSIEKGTSIFIPVDAIHHDPEYYDEPEKFKPERFEPSECEKRHACAYLPFGYGPRNCIGLRFGKMQTKIGLATLLTRYRFECCAETQIVLDNNNFLLTTDGCVKFKIVPL